MHKEYTPKQLMQALPSFRKIWEGEVEANRIPEGVKLTVYCDGGNEASKGFVENVKSSELGLNALIAHSWILQGDLDAMLDKSGSQHINDSKEFEKFM